MATHYTFNSDKRQILRKHNSLETIAPFAPHNCRSTTVLPCLHSTELR